MEKYKKYKEAFPNKTDAQCIESLCWEVSDKVETIHKLLEDNKYTEEDVRNAFNAGDAWGRADYVGNNQPFPDEDEYINSLNKQTND
jgi:hypothetical protein